MKLRDTLERMFWTALAAAIGAVPAGAVFNVATLKMVGGAAFTSFVSFLLIVARSRLAVLPNPGEGLPGLETESTIREG